MFWGGVLLLFESWVALGLIGIPFCSPCVTAGKVGMNCLGLSIDSRQHIQYLDGSPKLQSAYQMTLASFVRYVPLTQSITNGVTLTVACRKLDILGMGMSEPTSHCILNHPMAVTSWHWAQSPQCSRNWKFNSKPVVIQPVNKSAAACVIVVVYKYYMCLIAGICLYQASSIE